MRINYSMGQAVKATCKVCNYDDVAKCSETSCPLWYFRFGRSPEVFIKAHGAHTRKFFDKDSLDEWKLD